jgi:pyruvate/2-oxoglutarate dehydrogenase complex dihydrolipoamide acyltransferase (E2) component
MATEITVPKLGLTMTEANLVKWAVASGQSVTIEEIVAVIETDKVSFEIVAPAAGLVHPVIDVGTMVAVSQVIGYVAADDIRRIRAQMEVLKKVEPEQGVVRGS